MGKHKGASQVANRLFRQYVAQKWTWMRFVVTLVVGFYAWVGYREVAGATYPTQILPDLARDILVAVLLACNFFLSGFIDPLVESAMWVPPWAWAALVLVCVGFVCATGRESWLILVINLKSIWGLIQMRRGKLPPDDRHTYFGKHLNL